MLLATVFLVFYTVAEDVYEKETLSSIDPVFGQWLVTNISPLLDRTLVKDVTRFGSSQIIKYGAVLLVLFALYKRQWVSAAILTVSVYGGLFLNSAIKDFFMRPRPSFWGTVSVASGYSFPSNHSMGSVIFYGMIAYLLTSMISNRRLRILVWVGMGFLVVAVGLSRLLLGVHYLTDVLGGWLAGTTWLLACILVSEVFKGVIDTFLPNAWQKLKTRFQS